MCRYRYYYYGTCRHQKTVLFDFCENAQALPHDSIHPEVESSTVRNGKNYFDINREQAAGGADGNGNGNGDGCDFEEGASVVADPCPNSASFRSTTCTRSPHSTNSSFQRGTEIISAEPNVECTSLLADNLSHTLPSTPSSHGMASSLLGDAFSKWMNGASRATHMQNQDEESESIGSNHGMIHKQSTQVGSLSSRVRPSGIRQRTDESCDLPRMNEIFQHLAESCRGTNAQHVGIDGRRLNSHGSLATDHGYNEATEVTQQAYDTLEAEIDKLKEDITRLRDESDRGRTTPKTEQELANDRFLATRSLRGHPTSADPHSESAASRLQRQHEAETSNRLVTRQQENDMQQSLSLVHFPALEQNTSGSRPGSSTDQQTRKLSYADAITNGMLDANNHAFSAAIANRGDSKISESSSDEPASISTERSRSKTISTAATRDSSDGREDEDCSIIVSPRSIDTSSTSNDPVIVSKGQPSIQNGKPAKSTPHFAQPTQSYSRRTGESVRATLSPVSAKSSPGSPTKSMKSKDLCLATEKRATQRQQKRKSLPGDWVGADGQQSSSNTPECSSKTTKTAGAPQGKTPIAEEQKSPSSADGWQKVARRNVKEQVNLKRVQSNQYRAQSPLQSKANARPATNNVAKSRTPGMSQRAKTRLQSPPGTPAMVLSEVNEVDRDVRPTHRSNTVSSDASSVQFILDCNPSATSPVQGQTGEIGQLRPVTLSNNLARSIVSITAPSPLAAPPASPSKRTVSKLPRPTARTDHQSQQQATKNDLSASNDVARPRCFPEVSNTTVKRRFSHGHLLTPIMACLDAKGLLNKVATNNAMVESYLKSSSARAYINALKMARDSRPDPTSQISTEQSDIPMRPDGNVQTGKALPPHVRNSMKFSDVYSSEDSTPAANIGDLSALPVQTHGAAVECNSSEPFVNAEASPTLGLPLADHANQASRSSSLRATADEFRPMQPAPANQTPIKLRDALGYWSDEEWSKLNDFQRSAIYAMRKTFPRQPFHTDSEIAPPPIFNLQQPRDTNTPHLVQAGQVLKPSLLPGKKSVQWLLQDVDGTETPIKFGRAPAPIFSPSYDTSTPSMSSLGSPSPWKTPQTSDTHSSLQPWHIQSKRSPVRYGWTGGDGKEIKFLGYGPYAERNPNTLFDFDFQGRRSSYAAAVPNGFDEDKENSTSAVRVVPKSQSEWAKMLGYQRVPCGDMEITEAVEHCIPFGSQLAAYCHDCMAN